MTGAVKLDIPENFLRVTADLDGDGIPELLCLKTPGLQVPTYSQLSIYSVNANAPFEKWRCDCGRWYTTNLVYLPLNVYTVAESGKLTVALADIDDDGKLEFIIGRPEEDGGEICVVCGIGKEGVEERMRIFSPPGTHLEFLAISKLKNMDRNGCKLLVKLISRGEGKVSLKRATGTLKSWRPTGHPLSPPIMADLDGSSLPTILLERGGMEIVALKPPFEGENSKFCWCRSGRGWPTILV